MKKIIYVLSLLFLTSINIKGQAVGDSVIIQAFKQGRAGNCASVSVIKAAIATFGFSSIFEKIDTFSDSYHIHFRDGDTLILFKNEESVMANLDKFDTVEHNTKMPKNDSIILSQAKFLYAVMAKNSCRLNGYKTIKKAATHGAFSHKWLAKDTKDNIVLLGLKDNYKEIPVNKGAPDVLNKVIVCNNKHSAFCSDGKYDEYGKLCNIEQFKNLHKHPINSAYRLNK